MKFFLMISIMFFATLLHSYPLAYSITFDNDMKHVRVDFRMIYEGGEAILKNENGKWMLLTAQVTWTG